MLFSIALFGSLLAITPSVPVAIPFVLGTCVTRHSESHQSQTNNRLQQGIGAVSATQYSGNWAGAVWDKANGTFTSVTGTFVVPTPSGSIGASAAAWVGIDGDTCQGAILQTGVDFTISSSGPTYNAWYEWYPVPSHDFLNITVSAGDVIKLTVTAFSATSGTAMIENLTTGQNMFKNLTSSSPLCGQNAEWIVEDYALDNSLVPFADFGTVVFMNGEASGIGTYTPSGATLYNIARDKQVLTSVSTNGSSVTIKYA